MLKEIFIRLTETYSSDIVLAEKLWLEIERAYSGGGRHYHNLDHLKNLFTELEDVRHQIADWNSVLWALFYHDIVYQPIRSDNEEKSARRAQKRMEALKIPLPEMAKCKNHILATKSHPVSPDNDTNLFTDADLSILGQKREIYQAYSTNVRKEYAIYPDILYNPGRKKVLQHFLAMEQIFKTPHFQEKYEAQARANLEEELRN